MDLIGFDQIKQDLKNKKFSLISDAGSPLISDPGYKLVRYCIEADIYVSVIPGPSSLTSALQLSSITVDKYIFLGFLPKSEHSINIFINLIKETKITSVFFVSRYKIITLLNKLLKNLPDRKLAICKEITKINEKVFIGLPEEVLNEINKNTKNLLGEFVIVIEGGKNNKSQPNYINSETRGLIDKLLDKFSLTDTVDIVHKLGKLEKKGLYKKVLDIKNEK